MLIEPFFDIHPGAWYLQVRGSEHEPTWGIKELAGMKLGGRPWPKLVGPNLGLTFLGPVGSNLGPT